jgi:hypothetical protein
MTYFNDFNDFNDIHQYAQSTTINRLGNCNHIRDMYISTSGNIRPTQLGGPRYGLVSFTNAFVAMVRTW